MANVQGTSNDPNIAAVSGNHTTDGRGIEGISNAGQGVYGQSNEQAGVVGVSGKFIGVWGESKSPNQPGVIGISKDWQGIYGTSINQAGVVGVSEKFIGVWGESKDESPGILGKSKNTGVIGEGEAYGVHGVIQGTLGYKSQAGILGESKGDYGYGIIGKSNNIAISAESTQNTALIVTTRNRREMPALIINQWGTGDMIMGKDETNYVNFRVRKNGDTIVRNLMQTCDKNTKENFSDVSTIEILDKLVNIPIQSWNYKNTPPNERHIGPTAQDFQAAFGLNGDDDVQISAIDIQGVALAAIQGLNKKLKAENEELHTRLTRLEERLLVLESKG
ncbi:tail fiber domain-containing protein [Bacillus cereus]|uniref:tail fiber domain-containing protein n=1 Tax=Bacillus cereus TaxID=1396 RepID=UPI00203FA2B4|nr:tail fiber domain-containing protein [Bacillus cereus]MCM3222459.1 tail fiber domain-containing protein [Bacillus cereus]